MRKKSTLVLKELEKIATDGNPFWNISRETAEFLYVLSKSKKAGKILEVGTSNGYSGIYFAESCGKLWTIESNKKRFEIAKKNFVSARLTKKIKQIKGHAPEIMSSIKEKFDIVFLDATKYEYLSHFNSVITKLKKNGLIIADNVDSHKNNLGDFFREVKRNKNFQKFHVSIGSGILVLKKLQ